MNNLLGSSARGTEVKYWESIFNILNAIKEDIERYHTIMRNIDTYNQSIEMVDGNKYIITIFKVGNSLRCVIDINKVHIINFELVGNRILNYNLNITAGKRYTNILEHIYNVLK